MTQKERIENATTKQAVVFIWIYSWVIVRNLGRVINKAVHKLPWLFIMITVKKYKHTIVMILLVIAAIIAGYGFICFMVEHIFLSLLMLFCISCALAVEKEV